MALAKRYRLAKKRDFEKIKKEGRLVQTPLFSVLILGSQINAPRIGVIVSKKIDQRAVVRNQLRRRLAESLKSLLDRLPKDSWFLFLVKSKLKEAEFREIGQEIEKIL